MESCQICYEGEAKYKIQCGSTTPHCICYSCETTWRLKTKPTPKGRPLTCPFCRGVEKTPGNRSRSSYEAEIELLYKDLHMRRTPLHYEFQSQLDMVRSTHPYSLASSRLRDALLDMTAPARPRVTVPPPAPVPPVTVPPRSPSPIYDPSVAPASLPVAMDPASLPVAPMPPAMPITRTYAVHIPKRWCQSGRRELSMCPTQNKTQRKCSYPSGCDQFVCRDCRMCISHFPSS